MNSANDRVSQALRQLAAGAPQSAPPELGAKLNAAFVRHHAARRRRRIAFTVGIAATIALSAMFLRSGAPHGQTAQHHPETTQPRSVAPEVANPTKVAVKAPPAGKRKDKVSGHRQAPGPSMPAMNGDFIALSSFDPDIPMAQGRIVRLELPVSALRMAGYPVNADLLPRRVVTDVLVGQDGRPYAARLVQTRMDH